MFDHTHMPPIDGCFMYRIPSSIPYSCIHSQPRLTSMYQAYTCRVTIIGEGGGNRPQPQGGQPEGGHRRTPPVSKLVTSSAHQKAHKELLVSNIRQHFSASEDFVDHGFWWYFDIASKTHA